MKKPYLLTLLFVSSLAMTSCSESYDVKKPAEGGSASEITIPLNDGSNAVISANASKEDSLAVFSKLKSLDFNHSNWDAELDLKALDEYERGKLRTSGTYKVKSKVRTTDISDKHGYYRRIESANFVEEHAATNAFAISYSGYSIYKENNKYIGFFGRVPDAETIENINKSFERTVLYADPDYEPGIYTKDGVESFPEGGNDSLGFKGSRYFNSAETSIPFTNPVSLLANYVVGNQPELEASFTFKLTTKYLILNIEKPLGLYCFATPQEAGHIYERSNEFDCYFKAEAFYDVTDGKPAYFKASFKTLNFSPSYRAMPFEGTFAFKRQNESDEGYEKYMKMREEVMKNYTTRS